MSARKFCVIPSISDTSSKMSVDAYWRSTSAISNTASNMKHTSRGMMFISSGISRLRGISMSFM